MNNRLKTLALVFFLCLLVFSISTPLESQIRGKALYEKLTKEREKLVKFEGLAMVTWTPDGTAYYKFEKDTFVKIDPVTDQKSLLFDDDAIIQAYNTHTSKNEEKLPFRRFSYLDEGKKIRFMEGSIAYVYELASGKIISYVPEKDIIGVRGRIYSEVFSPDFKYRAFARDYNLYIQDLEGKERALTTDGHKDLRNGFPDWVYPEELDQYEVFWWSPDSKRIAFMRFDESPVGKYPIVHDIDPRPELELQSYPKAGSNNPIIHFFIVDIDSKKIIRIETGMETNVYLFRGQWTHDEKM
ncbi:MAG: DPP IV N-terminal domain-containing protein, partial [Candidatus Aminicenantes bacterium]|nr:DPP IV N-terminal domain-containing protein [Candidatus Aminicenantes bacterium]